ncbi:MAG: SDR family oxidoreductase [Pseudomonadota bacterium]
MHNGAAVHLTQPYSQVRAANVDGVRTILHLAGAGRLKPVAFVSTVGLFDTPELENLPAITETDGPVEPGLLPNGYTQSKWAGERLVEMAAGKGVPAATLRVGHVIGHGVSEDLAARLAQASFYSTSVPRIEKPIDYVSPDYVASAIVRIPRRLETFGGIYHVVNPEPFDQSDLELLLPFVPREITLVTRDVWLAELREAARADTDHPLFVALDALGDPDRPMETSFVEQILNRPRIDCARTLEAVGNLGVKSRPARDVLVDVLIGMPQLAEVFAGVDLERAAQDAKAASAAKAAAG